MTWFEKILLVLGGTGGIFSLRKQVLSFTKNRIQTASATKELVALVNYWRKDAEFHRLKYTQILNENTYLKMELNLNISERDAVPIPFWKKDISGKMVWCSSEYERVFLLPFGKSKSDVLFKTDEESWGEMGKEWSKNDLWCIKNKSSWTGEEKLPLSSETDSLITYVIHKNVILYNGNVVGVMGVALMKNKQ